MVGVLHDVKSFYLSKKIALTLINVKINISRNEKGESIYK